MASIIKHKRSSTQGSRPTTSDLQLGEIAINTHDGKMFFKRDAGGSLSIVEVGLDQSAVGVYYVSKSGSDSSAGTTLASSWATLEHAVQNVPRGATIYLKSGDYTIVNPITIPEDVAIIGDNLRNTIIRPTTKTSDILWVSNGSYIHDVTFKDHESPAAAVAFNPDASAGPISMSPYIQNCTSITTTGTGLRIDGSDATGTKSMVVDAFTQYNQGGIGVHIKNSGYAQLVSVFTICCDIGILCETGGFCSVTNSNSSFGNYGLKADGVGSLLQSATLVEQLTTKSYKIKGVIKKPQIGGAISINSANTYITVASTSALSIDSTLSVGPTFTNEAADLQTARSTVLGIKNTVQTDTIDYINETYPTFDYNGFKCTRDLGYIIDAVIDDMVLGTNYRSVTNGNSYLRASANTVLSEQLTETIAAINFAKSQVVSFISSNDAANTVSANFDIITGIMNGGTAPAIVYPDPTGVSTNAANAADNIQANRAFIIENAIGYSDIVLSPTIPDKAAYRTNIGEIIDAITYDILYGGNSQTIIHAEKYWEKDTWQYTEVEKTLIPQVYAQVKNDISGVITLSPLSPFQGDQSQVVSGLTAASITEQSKAESLIDLINSFITDKYTVTVTTEEDAATASTYTVGDTFEFYQYSLISGSSHTFEWVGSGVNINTALPAQGGVPIPANEVVEVNGGRVYYTATNQKGDFSIGADLVIDRNTGTITGNTFDRSLFAVLTPYILALEG